MGLPVLLGGAIAVAATRALAALRAARFVATKTADARKIQLASDYVGRNPKAISGPGFPSNFTSSEITKYTRMYMEKRPWQQRYGPEDLQLKKIGDTLFREQQKIADNLKQEFLESLPNAAKEAAALGALGLVTKIGADNIYVGDEGNDGPYKPKPRPGPRHKDPYEPNPSEPGGEKKPEEEKEELDDNSNSTSCVDDEVDTLFAKQEQKTEVTMFTPYGTLSSRIN